MRTIGMRTVLAMALVSSAATFLQPAGLPALRGARAATCSSPALRCAGARRTHDRTQCCSSMPPYEMHRTLSAHVRGSQCRGGASMRKHRRTD